MLQELVVRIHLPGVQQASQAQLNIEPQHLDLSVAGRYKLHLPLPYRVAEAEGSASFNAARAQLEVTLPVIPPKTPPRPAATGASSSQQQQQQQQSEAQTSADVHKNSLQHDGQAAHSQSQAQSASTDEPASGTSLAAQSNRASDSAGSSSELQKRPNASDPSSSYQVAAVQAQSQKLTDNQRKWAAMHQVPSTSTSVTDSVLPVAAEQADDVDALLAAAAAGTSKSMPPYCSTTSPALTSSQCMSCALDSGNSWRMLSWHTYD